MDPNETLRLLREAHDKHSDMADRADEAEGRAYIDLMTNMADVATDIAGYAHDLDEWLSNGGHLPTVWAGNRA